MRANGQIIPGTHRPMIAKEVLTTARRFSPPRGNPRPPVKEFTYRGFLVCGHCGCTVTAEEHVKRYPTTGREARYVHYRRSRSKGLCQERPVREEVLEAQFPDQLAAMELRSPRPVRRGD